MWYCFCGSEKKFVFLSIFSYFRSHYTCNYDLVPSNSTVEGVFRSRRNFVLGAIAGILLESAPQAALEMGS
jgi:hypothetical protein